MYKKISAEQVKASLRGVRPFVMDIQLFANLTDEAETNLVTKSQMAKVREVDFVQRFAHNSLAKLIEVLGVARKIPMSEGTTMYYYTTTGTLQDGAVAEGAVIPLSQYQRNKVPMGEITLNKWRKAVSAEAIMKSGRDEAVRATDDKLLSDVQKKVRTDFFTFITGLNGTVIGATTLQGVLAKTWAKLQVLFEDDTAEAVHFMNPLTIADDLATRTITTQTAFGMTYIADYLGMGTIILSSAIPVGQVFSTAKENIIMYYLQMNGDVAGAFNLTADSTGYIGINAEYAKNERAQVETLVMSGIQFLVEYADGVVIGQVDATPTLGSVTVTSAAGTAVGDSKITLSGYSLGTGESWVYKTAVSTAPTVTYGQKLGSTWTEIDSGDDITPTATHTKITVAAVDANGRAQAAGSATLTVKTDA